MKWMAIVILLAAGCKPQHSHVEAEGFFCPMHPTVESITPGVCPVCNMELVPKKSSGAAEPLSASEQLSAMHPSQKILGTVKTIRGEYTEKNQVIRANGVIAIDNRSVRTVSTRFSGRLEEVRATALYQPVQRGQVLATIFSPELLEAQRNYLEALQNPTALNAGHFNSRLTLLGLSAELIQKIRQTNQAMEKIPVLSPVDGFLIEAQTMEKDAAPQKGSSMMENNSPEKITPSSDSFIKSGDYVTAGQTLFFILEKNQLQLEINIRESDILKVKPGQLVIGNAANGKKITGAIRLVEPGGNASESFRKARVSVNESGLTIGMPVEAIIETGSEEGLWLPSTAVLDLGDKSMVFVKNENYFIPKEIITGNKQSGKIRILKGLATADEVAEVAGLLTDSDAFVSDINLEISGSSANGSENKSKSAPKSTLMMDERSIQLAGIKTSPAVTTLVSQKIQLNGKVMADPETRKVISSRIPGRIEELLVRETGRLVTAGQIVAQIHSPEILTILSELKLSIKNGTEGKNLADASRKKLLRYNFDEAQINEWIQSTDLPETIAIRSQVSGTVAEINVRPGKSISEGSPLITLENLSTLWVEAEVYPGEESLIKSGTKTMITIPGSGIPPAPGMTEQILPSYQEGTQLMIARIRIKNQQGFYRPGQTARILVESPRQPSIVIPASAVLSSSKGTSAFIQSGTNAFEKRMIRTGIHENGKIAIIEGISAGEQVVTNGGYLLESQLKLRPGKKEHEHH